MRLCVRLAAHSTLKEKRFMKWRHSSVNHPRSSREKTYRMDERHATTAGQPQAAATEKAPKWEGSESPESWRARQNVLSALLEKKAFF